jgi:serine/threonine protein phosphatase 1
VIYAIGDIHGQATMLRSMLEALREMPLRDEDTVVFLGDYVDRGEDSCGVIETLIQFRAEHEDTIFLRGNHEQLMLDARSSPEPEPSPEEGFVLFSDQMLLWLQNGGSDALLSYGLKNPLEWWESIPKSHWDFIRATTFDYITPRYHFVHAGLLLPGQSWEGEEWGLDPRLWIREPFLSSNRASYGGRIVVFGHTPQLSGRPLIQRNKIGLDTGAVFGGPLTMAAFDPNAPQRKFPAPQFTQIEHTRA